MRIGHRRKNLATCFMVALMGTSLVSGAQGEVQRYPGIEAERATFAPALPRWREGGTPYDPQQSLQPYVVSIQRLKDEPEYGLIASPPEYAPSRGVLFFYSSSAWPTVVRDLVVALTGDPQYDDIAYVVVTSTSQMNSAISLFTSGGADLNKVEFIIEPANSIWIRDYGPHFIWQDGALGLVDSHYYPGRSLDNFIPTLIADDHFIMPSYDMGLYYSGGNFLPGPRRTGFVTSLVTLDNSASEGFDQALIAELYHRYQGIDSLHIMPQLPSYVDGTGHIDMWMNITTDSTVIISQFKPGSDPTAIQITNDAVPYMEALGFKVNRTWAWNVGWTHYTYTNAFRVNDRFFVPTYGDGNPSYLDEDADALAQFQEAAGPNVEIIPIDCYDIIPAAGAIHCIVMQVPRYTEPEPAVHVMWPNGGELLPCGSTQTISWVATDTDNATIPQVDLYYSVDGGQFYDHIATTSNAGSYDWTVPDFPTDAAKIKVVATSVDLDQGEAVSADVFEVFPAHQTAYDFASGAGVEKFCKGYQTSSWSIVDGNRTPVSSEISSASYPKLAYSDAEGSDSDPNRYISPTPWSNYESTHIFEFTIEQDVEDIDAMTILWEGYADNCSQVEMYLWDYTAGQWTDAQGLYDQNRYMDNWAGNRDGYLNGYVRSDLGRYVGSRNQVTLLLYVERDNDETFHDFVRVTMSDINAQPYAPSNPDPHVGETEVDIDALLSWTGGDPNYGDTVTYDLYLGTDPDPPLLAESLTDTLYDPDLAPETMYYWRVVAHDEFDSSSAGSLWNFTTGQPPEQYFVRGDVQADGDHDVFDAVYILNWLGGIEPPPSCIKTADVEDDGDPDIFDAIRLLNWLGGLEPSPPSPCCGIPDNCGGDPTPDELTCEDYLPCDVKVMRLTGKGIN